MENVHLICNLTFLGLRSSFSAKYKFPLGGNLSARKGLTSFDTALL